MTRTILFSIIVMLCLPLSGLGADVKQQLQGIKKEINAKKRLIDKTVRVENMVSGELAKIDRNLREQQASLDKLNLELNQVDRNLLRIEAEIGVAKKDTAQRKLQIQKRLVAAYKSGYVGDIRFFFSAESFPRMLEDVRYMKSLLDNDRKMVAEYSRRIDRLKDLQGNLEQEARKKEKIKSSIELKKIEIETEKKKKAQYLVKVKEDKKNYQQSLRQLEANSKRLQSIIQRLESEARKRAAREKKARAAAKAGSKATSKASSSGTEQISPPLLSDKGFGSERGRLSMPVRGKIISGFGRHKHAQFSSYTFNNGISIAAPAGTAVHAVYDGSVVFASYFKGYGNMVIVDHGGGYFSLYAHNSKIMKNVGTSVSKNDILASVGDVDSANGPMLYFEIRYQGKPINPSLWVR